MIGIAGVIRGVSLAVLPLLAACAAGGTRSGGAPSEPEAVVEVHNNLLPRSSVTVRAISAAGTRTLLGSVSPGQTAVLRYEQPAFQGRYQFVAEADGGGPTVRSPGMVLRDGVRLVWTLQTNTLLEARD